MSGVPRATGSVRMGTTIDMTTHWNAFLPIGRFPDEPGLDPAWAAAMGVDKNALAVLRRVRRDVLPLVRKLQKQTFFAGCFFLVHDRVSGVPCPPEDASAYVHLQVSYVGKVNVKKYLS